jgi:hypothetical protein
LSNPGSAIDRRAAGLTPIHLRKVDGSIIDKEIAGAPVSSAHEVARSVCHDADCFAYIPHTLA